MGHKLISFCIAKEAINKKISYRLRENISNDATDKHLISKIYKQLIQLNIKRQTTQSKNGQKT